MRSLSILIASQLAAGACILPACAENLALHAPYSWSRPPLYDLTHDDGDAVQLTDGEQAPGTMWTSKKGVGWIAEDAPISIEIDLGTERSIGSICLRSARGQDAGVSFPRRVALYVSPDRRSYGWAGALSPLAEAGEGPYLAREFCSPDVAHHGRYVRLQVATRGGYFFTDEISVWAPKSGQSSSFDRTASELARPAAYKIPPEELRPFALEHEAISRTATDLGRKLSTDERARPARERLARVAHRLNDAVEPLDSATLIEIDDEIHRIAQAARAAEGTGLVVRRADPWPLATPVGGASLAIDTGTLDIPAGGHGAMAFLLEHAEPEAVSFAVSAVWDGRAGGTGLNVTAYEVATVTRADGVRLGDPLVRLRDGRITVGVGETRQLWLDIGANSDMPARNSAIHLRVEAIGTGGKLLREMALPVTVWPPPLSAVTPYTSVWGYLDTIPVRGHEGAAVADMLAHGVNTAVIPSGHYLPWPGPKSEPDSPQIGDYKNFDGIMRLLTGHRQVLFFLSLNSNSALRSFGGRHQFLSEPWKALFTAWIREWAARMRRAGFDYGRFAMYPIDEPHPGAEHDALVAVARLIKAADPKIRVYTTLHVPQTLSNDLMEVVDIFQLNGKALTPAIVEQLQARGKSVSSYATTGGKAADPTTFYRALAWDCFLMGLEGFGFWAYGDAGNSGSAWNDIDDARPDHAVIYESADGIVSSKRWEAWREGVQDFAILSAAYQAARTASERQGVLALVRKGRADLADPTALAADRRALFDRARDTHPGRTQHWHDRRHRDRR